MSSSPQRAPAARPEERSAPAVSLRGARIHNLQGIDLDFSLGEVVAITGVSGSGKSSLALDTLYAEGQRRFVESFSPYARQFLERLERPPMTSLEPVPAGVAVDRRAPVKSSRSTVATMADIEPYLAALFVREAVPVCPVHQVPAMDLDVQAATRRGLQELGARPAVVTYRERVADREAYLVVRERLAQEGYRRLWLRGQTRDLDEVKPSEAAAGGVSVVVDRLRDVRRDSERLAAGIEQAWNRGAGVATLHSEEHAVVLRRGLGCPRCDHVFRELKPGLFSYESPLGACPDCRGFGRILGIDWAKVIPDPSRTLKGRAIRPWSTPSSEWERAELSKLCRRHGIPADVPWEHLDPSQQRLILEGDGSWDEGRFPGVRGWFRWLETKTYKLHVRVLLARYRAYDPCPTCGGHRLNEDALAYQVAGRNIAEWHALEIHEARRLAADLAPRSAQGELVRRELSSRLEYLERVGLGYLTLDRQARTLSGGEAQRVTLTAALGTSLYNALFVLDEPTVGLHPLDVEALAGLVRELGKRGNLVLVVEHDPQLIAAADRVVELGPGAGTAGGTVVADGPLAEVVAREGATARAVRGPRERTSKERSPQGWLRVRGASAHNLQRIDVDLPLGMVTALAGPSGSGKSTLAINVVYRGLARQLGLLDVDPPGEHRALEGAERIGRVTLVDQSPLGRTSRGNAATYTKAWDLIRKRFAAEPDAVSRDLTAADFSFNVARGRCEACAGEGFETVEMQFLADVRLICPVCQGRRFKEHVLAVKHRGLGVAELLAQTIDQTLESFRDEPAILRALGPVQRLGLGYLRLGQPLSTLSGGEAQRLKVGRALGERNEHALFVLDEPSAGLHADEVALVVEALELLVRGGASVLVVEHDLDLLGRADWLLELGPGGGHAGGRLVWSGPPSGLAQADTATGRAWRARRQLSKSPVTGRAPSSRRVGAAKRSTASALSPSQLLVERAREHNLKEISVAVPHGALTVVTGPSGSGKSTFAFDVVFAEGQRRFLETLTPYARQFLPTLPRPDVDRVTGVPPAIALEQRTTRAGPRSTVATVTEVAHYLRLLYAKAGVAHCPDHAVPIQAESAEEVRERVRACKGRADLLAPAVIARKGLYLDLFAAAAQAGILEAWCDGARVSTDAPPRLARNREHAIDLIVAEDLRLTKVEQECIDRALEWGNGRLKLRWPHGEEVLVSAKGSCPECGLSVPELDPRVFSFNTKQGQCAVCEGSGVVTAEATATRKHREAETLQRPCPSCDGTRLAPIPRAVRLQGERYSDFVALSVELALTRAKNWRFPAARQAVTGPVLQELVRRLAFLQEVGLGYLGLDRLAITLSGGEIQRLRLAAQLGAGLTGALYVLDEPTIGLHPRDTGRLLGNLRQLITMGSTVLLVEHDEATIRAADYLVDLGPSGGAAGGRVMAAGPPREVLGTAESPTGIALSSAPALRAARPVVGAQDWLALGGVSAHNLSNIDVRFPLGRLTVVAGVSGSGKSTLVRQVLLPAVRQHLGLTTPAPGAHDSLTGWRSLRRALAVDQSPIGRTPRSVPATFLGIWDGIRQLFAATPEARTRGFAAARFSFNTSTGGRCPTCEGQGAITHEMSFLPDVTTPCPACDGKRFEPQTLAVGYRGLSIGEVLELTADEAVEVFAAHPQLVSPLRTLSDLGAGYIRLGQGSPTLSGGEAQRLKLAAEVTASLRHEPTLYVLDEPTTGLHLADVHKLMRVLDRLVERGDTLVVIEHHPIVMAGADWTVELGPEGGARGGRVVATGTPRTVAGRRTATGDVLRELFG